MLDTAEIKNLYNRIGINSDIDSISRIICENYQLGDFKSYELIPIGYEDFNFFLFTTTGKYCVKIFSKRRSAENVINYLDRISAVSKSDVRSPKPLTNHGNISLSVNCNQLHYDICVFECIAGENYYELHEKPNWEDLAEIAKQAALINRIQTRPNFIYDAWAIGNFEKEYNQKKDCLSEKYKRAFSELLREYSSINPDVLPKAFVHGDIINTNVIKDNDSRIWIIDYAVSNYLPRIVELAVIACNLCLDEKSEDNTINRISFLLCEYNKYNKLQDCEINAFEVFYKIANAMHILQTQYIIRTEGDSPENSYWLNEGMVGYTFSECKSFFSRITKQYSQYH